MARPALLIPTTEWKLRIPVDLAAKADLLILDPVKGKIAYGARSELITRLLRAYLQSMQHQVPIDKLEEGGDNN